MSRLQILLADDHPLFRDGIASLLAAWDIEVVGHAGDGIEAIEKAAELLPDVILMDIHMPRMNGLEATRQIKERWPQIRIVILTVSDDDEHLFEAIKFGAQGYLLKNLDAEKFGEMINEVADGETALSSGMATRILNEFARQSHQPAAPRAKDDPEELTTREIEVLNLLGEGRTNRDIGQLLSVSENTVKFHVRHILSKLHLRSRSHAAAYAARKNLNDKPGQA